MSAKWRQAVEQSPLYRTPRGHKHHSEASDRSCRQLLAWLAWKSDHRRHSGLVMGWTQTQAAAELGMSRRTVQRAQKRLERDGMYVELVRGSSCGAPGQKRRTVQSVGLLTPVPTVGSNVGPIDHEDQRRVLTMVTFTLTTSKRQPLRITHPLIVRLSAYMSGQQADQKASVETPEGVSRDTRRRHSGALQYSSKSTYQVQARTVTSEPAPDTNDGLPRDSGESLAIEHSADMRDADYLERERERQMAELQRKYAAQFAAADEAS